MKILVVGSGGREYAIIKKLLDDGGADVIAAPGNGGIARLVPCFDVEAIDIDGIVRLAQDQRVDYVVVAPDDPLVLGAVDARDAAGIPAFGPTAGAARLEGSKSFAKNFMDRHEIPTAAYAVFDAEEPAIAYLDKCDYPIVVKADGLALGKGVVVAANREEAKTAISDCLGGKFGLAGATIVIEEFLVGPEVTVLAFADGTTFVPMVSAMDHKQVYDGGTGPNTGGMGTIAPNPFYTADVAKVVERDIIGPTIAGMAADGVPFRGCLYTGLILTASGPKVIEFNARFGDPETQVVLPLMTSRLIDAMMACTAGTLRSDLVEFSEEAAACVVVCSYGYPLAARTGDPVTIDPAAEPFVVVAGAKLADPADPDSQLTTSGGRVLGVRAVAPTLKEALDFAYERVDLVQFPDAHYRRDIGAAALEVR